MVAFPKWNDEDLEALLVFLQDNPDLFNPAAIMLIPRLSNMTFLRLRLDSQVYFYDRLANGSIAIYEIYSIKSGPHIRRLIGVWSPEAGIAVFEPNIWVRRQDLMGVEIMNSVLPWSVFLQYKLDSKGNIVEYRGMFRDSMDRLVAKLNFTQVLVRPPDGKWGSLAADGKTWNGIVKMLIDGKADISAGGLTLTRGRANAVDFSIPLMKEDMTLIAPRSDGKLNQFWVYLEIFPTDTWIIVTVVVLALSAGYCMSNAYGPANQPMDELQGQWALKPLAVHCLYLLQLGVDTCTTHMSAKILFMSANLFAYLIFTYYTCDLTARMTSGPPPFSIR